MKLGKLFWTSAAVLLAVTLTSCNIGKAPEPTANVNAIYTSAAQTMVAGLGSQQTQTAKALPPTATSTPLATNTPLPTFPISTGAIPFGTPGTPFVFGTPSTANPTLPSGTGVVSFPVGCNDATYLGGNAIVTHDGTTVKGGDVFEASWKMLNSGTCKWDDGYSFAFKSGDQMQGESFLFSKINSSSFTSPRQSITFTIQMQAPRLSGEYKGFWQMKNDAGVWFGSLVWVDVNVAGKGQRPVTPTP